ncbi:IS3 family transposase, partial [Lentilactobacillus sp. IMAU92037]|nr:IS3 family transposase [Lentilactobacillus dabitei]
KNSFLLRDDLFIIRSLKSCLRNQLTSMSRKGNCHDNAPIESFFNLMKRECLNRYQINDITALRKLVKQYIQWFNNERISRNKNGLTPVEYRNQAMVA